jgi:type I restriction-modification system DNA methylase subunit
VQDLFSYSTLKSSYIPIYQSLVNMRELFHQTGRFDDSNAKLDEVIKLVAMYLAFKRGLINHFPDPDEHKRNLVTLLHQTFVETIKLNCYLNQNGTSIFGSNPRLLLRDEDEVIAKSLVSLVRISIDSALMNKEIDNPFDILNEAFGHFVRDNFRSNIEDAQYMTPPEVVDFMVNVALEDLQREIAVNPNDNPFIMLDPTCGVGSFLTAFYNKTKSSKLWQNRKVKLIGQDKVERMIRLSKINLELFDAVDYQVTIGNSLFKESPITPFNGTVNLILTNPPFGAKFNKNDIISFGTENLPIIAPKCDRLKNVASELLFVDRNISLLKEGGRLLIIVPDNVVSANGIPALLRQQLKNQVTIRAIIELPPATFAQAGTHTKTCILYLIKGKIPLKTVFVAKSEHLGFEVSTRKGVQLKISKGENDLRTIFDAYKSSNQQINSHRTVITEKPSSVTIDYNELINSSWTPNHYSAPLLKTIFQLERISEIQPIPLSDLVEFQSDKRKDERYDRDGYFISVLHVIGEGMLDMHGIKTYQPKTPGIKVEPGEILFSKINPRIPRVFVMPDFGKKTLCSSEFEVMSAKKGADPYLISFLLLSNSVQSQVQSLTSGTSASHNRIKTAALSKVLLPYPKAGSNYETKLITLIKDYRIALDLMTEQTKKLSTIREIGDHLGG